MTKEQMIFLLLTRANGQDVVPDRQRKYHRGDIERHLEMAFSDVVREVYNNGVRYRDYGQLDPLIKTFEKVSIQLLETRGKYYSDLPINVVNLPDNAGIRMVTPRCNEMIPYMRIPNGGEQVYEGLDVHITGEHRVKTYWVEGTRIFYDKLNSDYTDALMKLIPDFSSYEDEDEIPVVSGYEGRVFDLALQRVLNEIPADLINDHNPKIV